LLRIALLGLEGAEMLLLLLLGLLNAGQPVGKRVWIVRVCRHRGNEESQRHKGAGDPPDYSDGAPGGGPVGPGSCRGVKPTPPRGVGAPLGFFSFFFFLTSRLPLSRALAMDPASHT